MVFLLIILTLLVYASELQLSRLPTFGTPPKAMTNVAATYNNETNEILIFGGQSLETEHYSSTIYKFNLNTFLWGEEFCGSELKPTGLMSAIVLMQSSTKLLVLFGNVFDEISSDCYSFDFETQSWEIEKLKGDKISGRVKSAYCEFEYNSTRFLAIYGGTTYKGISNELYLIDIETLVVRKIETSNAPKSINDASLVFHSDLETMNWTTITIKANQSLSIPKSFIINESMYVFFGFNYTESAFAPEIIKINLTDYSFTVVYKDDSPLVLQASVQINSIVYFLFGQRDTYLNSITKYEVTESKVIKTVVVENALYPSKRRNHASFQFDNEIYVFGGISDIGEYLNDIWKFDIIEGVWSKLEVYGDIPEARELMGYTTFTGYGLVIFGGRSNKVFSDLYNFEVKNKLWYSAELASAEPPARYSSCIANYDFRKIIIGGQNEYMGFSDIWIFDRVTKSYIKATTTDLPFELINHKCSLEEVDSDTVNIYVIGGSNLKHYPNQSVYKVEIKGFTTLKFEVKTERVFTSLHLKSSESPLISGLGYLILISGSRIRNYVSSKIFYYNISANTVEIKDLPNEFGLFGHTAVHLGTSIYIFGGGLSVFGTRIAGSTSNQLYKLSWDELPCGSGSQGPLCEACIKGYYENSGVCLPCQPGTYSNVIGASGEIECIPCEYSTYNDKSGQSYCKECSYNYYCPIRSTEIQSERVDLVPFSEQPEDYKNQNQLLSTIQIKLSSFILGVLSVILFVILFFKPVKSRLKCLDLFINNHSQKLGTPVILRQTNIGGIFSLYFLSLALITICIALMGYIYDNISEIKTLVPIVTLSDSIKSSTLTVEFQLYEYKGDCQYNENYKPENDITESGITYGSRTASCELRKATCSVYIVYEDFHLISDGYLNFTGKNISVSTTFFTVNIEASSSIPEGKSKSFVPVYPEDRKKLFRGLDATNVNFEFIPSVFKSDNDLFKDNTGYHVRYKPPYTPGTTINQQEFYSNAYLIISLKFEISSTGFITKRSQIYSFGIFIGGLLGTIFGLMGSFGFAMGFSEEFLNKYSELLKKKRIRAIMIKNREKIIDNFEIGNKNDKSLITLMKKMSETSQSFN